MLTVNTVNSSDILVRRVRLVIVVTSQCKVVHLYLYIFLWFFKKLLFNLTLDLISVQFTTNWKKTGNKIFYHLCNFNDWNSDRTQDLYYLQSYTYLYYRLYYSYSLTKLHTNTVTSDLNTFLNIINTFKYNIVN